LGGGQAQVILELRDIVELRSEHYQSGKLSRYA
jgi:hypothetical protein